MSVHKLSAGTGYTYLTRQVAVGDSTQRGSLTLSEYYTAKGEAPGRWVGSGLASLGMDVGSQVTQSHMLNLFGDGHHPDSDVIRQRLLAQGVGLPVAEAATRLGALYPVQDSGTVWRRRLLDAYGRWNTERGRAVGAPIPVDVRPGIRTELATEMFAETYRRIPATGHELTSFMIEVSRPRSTAVAGYDLTFSPVKSVSVVWALAPVEVSEQIADAHQAAVDDVIGWLESEAAFTRVGAGGVAQVDTTGLVGAAFTHRDSRAGDPDLHTHVAIANKVQTLDGRWLALDGRMIYRNVVAASERYNTVLEREMTARFGCEFAAVPGVPGRRAVRELVGVPRELVEAWSQRAAMIAARRSELIADFRADHGRLPTPVETVALSQRANLDTRQAKHEAQSWAEQRAMWRVAAVDLLGSDRAVAEVVESVTGPVVGRDSGVFDVPDLARRVLSVVEGSRAQWRRNHLLAEVFRQLRASGIAHRIDEVAGQVCDLIIRDMSIPIVGHTEPDALVPGPLRRGTGESVYSVHGAHMYTSQDILDAEARIVAAAGRCGVRTVDRADVDIALLEWSANHDGRVLNASQAHLVQHIACTDRQVMLALAPAGTGKTTAMGVLAGAWQATGGIVIGLAPQASAAAELAESIGQIISDTVDKFVHDHTPGAVGATPDRWAKVLGQDTLVIIDEAGLASTRNLDAVISTVTAAGGRVLLIGDDRQRAAHGAGGVLRDIDATYPAVSLDEVMRFVDPVQGRASLALRDGDTAALGYYADQHHITAVTDDTAIDTVYRAWAADQAAGTPAIMVAATLAQVGELNARARADRLLRDGVSGPELRLPSGETVSAGDVIVTKKNARALSLGGTDFVRNNDRWIVTAVGHDGSIRAALIGRGIDRTLPSWYVHAGHVRLGYAHTAAGVQGMTIGDRDRPGVAHVLVAASMTRNDLYPSLTRATGANIAYVPVAGTGHQIDAITVGGGRPSTAAEILAEIISRDGRDVSASTAIAATRTPQTRLAHAAPAYGHAVMSYVENVLGPAVISDLSRQAELVVPGISAAPAWEVLRGHLAVLTVQGAPAIERLRQAADRYGLDTAGDIAAVLDWRLDPTGNHSLGQGPLPWLPDVPPILAGCPEWDTYLQARADMVVGLADDIRALAATWTPASAPAWAQAYLGDPDLVTRLAVWRYAHGISDDDLTPAGPPPPTIAHRQIHRDLIGAAIATAGDRTDTATRWAAVIADTGVPLTPITTDPYWPVLVGKLGAAATTGMPVATLLRAAVTQAPIPVDHPAAALWWRLAPHLGPVATAPITSYRIHPDWESGLAQILGADLTNTITSDRLWPAIITQIDGAQRSGSDPYVVAHDAAGLLRAHLEVTPPHQLAAAYAASVAILTGPPPDTDLPPGPDPQDADIAPPADAQTASVLPTTDSWQLMVDPDTVAVTDPSEEIPADTDPAIPATRLHHVLAAAWDYYTHRAATSWVPGYLTSRGLPADIAGYAPAGWHLLTDHLRAAGYTDQEILAAGLAKHGRTGHLIDVLRDRAVTAIHNPEGQIVAMIGRRSPTLTDTDRAPKYLNTPNTVLWHKGQTPYGLTKAATDQLRAGATLIIAEGPMDAAAITAAATTTGANLVAIAPLGTALTPGHLATLDKIAPLADRQIIIAMDTDTAGHAAADRAYRLFAARNIQPVAPTMPGNDPADILATGGPHALAATLANTHPLAHDVIDRAINQYPMRLSWSEHRIGAARDAATIIATITDPETRAQHIHHTANKIGLPTDQMSDLVIDAQTPPPNTPDLPTRPTLTSQIGRRDRSTEQQIIADYLAEQRNPAHPADRDKLDQFTGLPEIGLRPNR